MPLFEVAIIEKPTKKDLEDGKTERLVFGPKAVIARDMQSAAINAVMDGDALASDVDRQRIEVLVRPFA
jgi:hypothetical protein